MGRWLGKILARQTGTDWFVSTTGNSGNAGTIGSPWDLATGLSGGTGGTTVKPGDRVNLRSGTYTGRFTCNMSGTAGAPITVRPWPADGNWWTYPAKIDNGGGTLTTTVQVSCNYITFRDLEVFCSVGLRTSAQAGSSPTDLNSGSGFGSTSGGSTYTGNQIINCLVHDVTDGIGIFTEGVNLTIYGNLIYNSGWDGPAGDRGHGHSVYMQNDAQANAGSVRTVRQNIMVNCFADQLNMFSQGGRVDNMQTQENISYSPAGASNLPTGARAMLWSGGPLSSSPNMDGWIKDSIFYIPDSMPAVSTPNYFNAIAADGDAPFGNLTLTNSRYFSFSSAVGAQFSGVFNGPNTITGNTFLQTIGTDNATITTANFPTNTYITSKPGSNETFLFVNAYRPGMGYLCVCNWTLASTVAVDISSVVTSGRTYEIRDASNYWATPCLSGTYAGGTVAVPMTGLSCAVPLGTSVPKTPATTAPEFNAFVVIQTS